MSENEEIIRLFNEAEKTVEEWTSALVRTIRIGDVHDGAVTINVNLPPAREKSGKRTEGDSPE